MKQNFWTKKQEQFLIGMKKEGIFTHILFTEEAKDIREKYFPDKTRTAIKNKYERLEVR